jgi:peptide/nickel transport system permease protein
VIGERELDYVTSARLRGESSAFIMGREILPNIMSPIIVELTVRIGYAIFTVSTLSFLGVGLQRPSPDWGLAIADGRDLLRANVWWPVTFPALAIATLVIGVNLIADSIQAVYER